MQRLPLQKGRSGEPTRRLPRTLLLALVACLALSLVIRADSAMAHVEVDVGEGQYVMEIGFRDEPAFVGLPNAVFVHVEEYATGGTEPVDGLAETLMAEVTKDGQSFNPPLVPMGEGSYEAIFVPTATGDYTFRISGTIGDATIDESVTSGPQTFNSVEPLTSIEFPAPGPDTAELATTAQNAQAEAATARILGLAGIAVGVLGLIVAGVALARSGRSQPTASSARASEPTGKLIR